MMIWWVALLFFAGIFLLFAEIFVPGGICGVFGCLALAGSCVIGWMWYPEIGGWIVLGELAAAVIVVALGLYIFPRTAIARSLVLEKNLDTAEGFVSDESDESLVGVLAEAVTTLRPAGMIMANNRRISAVANGGYIKRGAHVRIIRVDGNRVVVEAVD